MPYIKPTPADIKADFPQFAALDDAVIQRRIDRNNPSTGVYMWVDESWLQSDFTWAWENLTAYFLTDDGLGTGTDSELANQGLSGVSRLKSGTLDVTFKSSTDSGTGNVPAPWNANKYGIAFYNLLLKKGKTVSVVHGGGCGIAAAATDTPWAWRYNGWAL